MSTKWWQNEIVYQIYPRSFQDTNHDGIGDIQGMIDHLDYIQELGVTMIWVSPIYKSPMVDMGYDIADYQDIDPQFGSLDEFKVFLSEAKKRHIKVIMDLVVNHTSDQHEWFKQALADPKSKYRDYFIFKTTDDGDVPNNWRSIFGGSTWEPVADEPNTFYFHTFAPQQPDLNWENPALRQEIYQMINWWLELGVAGFRVDAITHLKKDLDWASLPADGSDGLVSVIKKGQNRPGIDVFLNELKQETFDKYDAITVGEAYGVPEKDLKKYIGPNGYFSMIFDFSYMNIDVLNTDEWYRGRSQWTVKDLREALFESQQVAGQVHGTLANVLENHDQPRVLSKLVPDKHDQTPTAAKALATMYYFLPGVPFIYQGQEIGMKNFVRKDISEFNDVSSINNYQMALKDGYSKESALASINDKSRDNARVPMQWNDSKFAGFSDTEPWLGMGNDREGIDVQTELADENSVLNYYKKLGQLHHDLAWQSVITTGDFQPIDSLPENVIGYQRILDGQVLTVFVNLSHELAEFDAHNVGDRLEKVGDITIDNDHVKMAGYSAVVMGLHAN
ncbi:alpha-glucosidase [Weissella paramesenteroides]|uniref:glycoside hydrolase family 13 protein n=1 Tax=Weissella paramesenteroides TaxID=1249 RepID=UPI00123BF99A|nr:alpha-glucosidase [Weissella paramesenteroides]KAA8439498.1 alpha-glucosidase [Weissella paramesenteroides]KAA8441235.1 alpha-glucosidase [Weissella paramesenteroides]KAA8441557.1 alpha-glucosidase [Weissella paramesenteroides]KAA8445840.1 alpha-glucosidase [Weissella paramesenteroides]KAA8449477.1 alpha-glucosidase [Weissella paramesenteroides]